MNANPTDPIASILQGASIGTTERQLRMELEGLDRRGQAEVVAKQLESTFLSMMLRSMRETVPEGGIFGNDSASKMFTGMLDQEYSQLASERWQFGFHDELVRQIMGPGLEPKPPGDGLPEDSSEAVESPLTD